MTHPWLPIARTIVSVMVAVALATSAQAQHAHDHADGHADEASHAHAHADDHADAHTADHEHGTAPAPAGMTVSLDVRPDPMSGYNVQIVTTGFTWAPERASTRHVGGEGHAHLYVDGEKVARVYGPWFHLPSLPDGAPERGAEVRVTLNTNAHHDYVRGGAVVADTVVLGPAEEGHAPTDADAGPVGANAVAVGDLLLRVEPVLADDGRLVVAATTLRRGLQAGVELEGSVRAPSGRTVAFEASGSTALAAFDRAEPGRYRVEGRADGVPFATELVAHRGATDLASDVVAFLVPAPGSGSDRAELFTYAFAGGENVHARYAASMRAAAGDGGTSRAELDHTHFAHVGVLPFAPAGNQATLDLAGDGPWRLEIELGAGVTESVRFEVPDGELDGE